MLDGLAELCATRGGDGSVFNERGFKSAAASLRMLGTQITDIEQLKVWAPRHSVVVAVVVIVVFASFEGVLIRR